MDSRDDEFKMPGDDTLESPAESFDSEAGHAQAGSGPAAASQEGSDAEAQPSEWGYFVVLFLIIATLGYGLYRVYAAYTVSDTPEKLAIESTQSQSNTGSPDQTAAQLKALAAANQQRVESLKESMSTQNDDHSSELRALAGTVRDQISNQRSQSQLIDQQRQELSALKEQLSELRTTLGRLSQALEGGQHHENISSSLRVLAERQDEQAAAIQLLIHRTAEKKAPVEAVRHRYHLIAAIEGRAWVQNNHGHEFTVTVGDSLKDAGKVSRIDPVNGVVETTEGHNITFHRS